MPIQIIRKEGRVVGYKWGDSGKVYSSREDAIRQGRAISISKARAKGYSIPKKRIVRRRRDGVFQRYWRK